MNTKEQDQAWNARFAELERKYAIKAAEDWMDRAIKIAERQVEELRRYRERFNQAMNPDPKERVFMTPVDVLGSFASETQNTTSNLNMGALLTIASNLSRTLEEKK